MTNQELIKEIAGVIKSKRDFCRCKVCKSMEGILNSVMNDLSRLFEREDKKDDNHIFDWKCKKCLGFNWQHNKKCRFCGKSERSEEPVGFNPSQFKKMCGVE